MAKRRLMLRQRQKSSGGGLLAFVVLLMTVGACFLISPPKPVDVAAVFAKGYSSKTSSGDTIVLPSKSWFLVISNSQAVAACGTLMEAEIIRESYGEFSSIQAVEANPISMRVTASKQQMAALSQGADTLMEVFANLDRMAHLPPEDAAAHAKNNYQHLSKLFDTMDAALSGTQNTVARGLCGLIASCREVMGDLSVNPTTQRIQYQYASLVQQYVAYTDFLAGIV